MIITEENVLKSKTMRDLRQKTTMYHHIDTRDYCRRY